MNVLVIGATGGTGRAAVHALRQRGHSVTALSRSTPDPAFPDDVQVVQGDALVPADLDRALDRQNAVVVSLGRGPNAFKTRLGIGMSTPPDLVARGTTEVLAAMKRAEVRRLIVISAFGVGDSWHATPLVARLFMRVFLTGEFREKARQEDAVRASGTDWTILRPVQLTDGDASGSARAGSADDVEKGTVSRADVGEITADVLEDRATHGATLAVSG